MAVDMFIKFSNGIKGGTADKHQTDACDLLAFSWGMTQSGSFHYGSGGGAGKCSFQDLSFTKYVDSASTAIMKHCANGVHLDSATLLVRKAGSAVGNEAEKDMEITMTKVIVTSISSGGSGGEDRFTENISLNFAEIKFENFKQDDKGTSSSAGEFEYNIAENTGK